MKSTFVRIAAVGAIGCVLIAGILVSRPFRVRPASAGAPAGHDIYTNALIHSTSPYLLEHAHNPVNWYPWGAEALARARAEKKPIFLSIGYSACHWCHVMRREDFENIAIARILNAHFVCIKVDREQRPDIDAQYLSAVELITGSGGWPLSVFLMPDLKPFYGGTYFPPDEFKALLLKIADLYQKQPAALQQQADRIAAAVAGSSAPAGTGQPAAIGADALQRAVDHLKARYDPVNGGFGSAPKFPEAPNLRFLLDRYQATHDPALLKMVTHTLDEMAAGGIYDQLAGGFHRYSVDDHWRVPHFEKMLYDQALLIPIYLDAYQITHHALYRRIAAQTLNFVERAFRLPGGAFASSFDADSDGVEGKYYLWTPDQVKAVLGPEAPEFEARFGVSSAGDLNGKSVLHQNPAEMAASADQEAPARDARPAGQERSVESLRERMLAARDRRIAPGRDDKALAGWNGLAIAAFARGYQVLGDRRYLNDALGAARFIASKMMVKGELMRCFYAGSVSTPALLNDEAFLIRGYLALYDATHDTQWLDRSTKLARDMIRRFEDPVRGGFYATASQGDLLARRKEADDNEMPSGNGAAAEDLARIAALTANSEWRTTAVRTARAFQPLISRAPEAFPTLLTAYTLAGGQSLAPAAIVTLTSKSDGSVVQPGGTLTITLDGNVAAGYHVNAHEPGDKTVIPTTIELAKTPVAQLVRVNYPAAERLQLAGGDSELVYRGRFSLRAVVRMAKDTPPGPATLRFVMTYQPCSDRECLAPSKITTQVVTQVAPKS